LGLPQVLCRDRVEQHSWPVDLADALARRVATGDSVGDLRAWSGRCPGVCSSFAAQATSLARANRCPVRSNSSCSPRTSRTSPIVSTMSSVRERGRWQQPANHGHRGARRGDWRS
jgi:hypothetical protein